MSQSINRRHRDRHRSRRSDPKTIKRLDRQENAFDAQATRLNALTGVAGVTRDEIAESFRRGPDITADVQVRTVDTRFERIRDVGEPASNVTDLGIPVA